jgi:hypothetical protein
VRENSLFGQKTGKIHVSWCTSIVRIRLICWGFGMVFPKGLPTELGICFSGTGKGFARNRELVGPQMGTQFTSWLGVKRWSIRRLTWLISESRKEQSGDKRNPLYEWGEDYLPWLYRHHQAGDYIPAGDFDHILRAEPEAFGDPLRQDYLGRALRGELRPRRGRKKLGMARRLSLQLAHWDIAERAEEIRHLRRLTRQAPQTGCRQ